MGLFSPVKKHANKFRYIPRYYDPEKERREQRRKELHGTSSELDSAEYQPGQYIRTQREARRLSQAERPQRRGSSIMLWVALAALLVLGYIFLPRIVEKFTKTSAPQTTQEQLEIEEFNPYAPITIVPNNYKEE
ncbi:MAG: hypothetical protein IIX82_02725 [Alistipes sp.]|nr:hypothetical protein [Alistipes sp.]